MTMSRADIKALLNVLYHTYKFIMDLYFIVKHVRYVISN